MTDEEKFLEQLLIVYKNNPIFRDNLAFLTQGSLRNLSANIINESINRVEDFFRYDLMTALAPSPLKSAAYLNR